MKTDQSTAPRGRIKLLDTAPTVAHHPQTQRPRSIQVPKEATVAHGRLEVRFEDEGEIGRGGMGSIHRVHERTLNRTIAVKILPPELAADEDVRRRFLAEAQVTGQLEHPNIVPVYELGSDDADALYFAMRLIDGETFAAWLTRHQMSSAEDIEAALEIFLRVCDALSFAHSRDVVHRDVKPSNIMVAEHGQVYLMDWGIARVLSEQSNVSATPKDGLKRRTKLTLPVPDERGLVLGTYAYMSPEQATCKIDEIDPRTDVFGLGAVLFRIVSGVAPIWGETPTDALARAAYAELVNVDDEVSDPLKRALLEVAVQAMQRDRRERFQSVQALKSAVQEALRGRHRFPLVCFARGSTILEEGAAGEDAYYIRSGTCRVFHQRDGIKRPLRTLGVGEVFGETAVFTGQPRNASIEATTDVELIVVPGRHLAEEVGLGSWLGAFVRALGHRFSEQSQRVAQLDHALTRAEVLAAAWRQLATEGQRCPDGTCLGGVLALHATLEVHHPLSRGGLERILLECGFALEGDQFRSPA